MYHVNFVYKIFDLSIAYWAYYGDRHIIHNTLSYTIT